MELTDEKLNYLVEATPGNKAIVKVEGDRLAALFLSPALRSTLGLDSAEFDRMTKYDAADMVFPEDLPALKDSIKECVRTRRPVTAYWRVVHSQQGFVWVHGSASYCGERDGCPVLFVAYGSDLTEIDLYRDVVDNSQTIAYVCDCNTYEILYANKAAAEYGGMGSTHPQGLPCYSYIQGKQIPCEECVMRSVKHGETLSLDRFNSRRGTWERMHGKHINWCGRDAFIQYITDITDQVQNQINLRELADLHRLQLEATQILNDQGDIGGRMNAALEKMRQYYQAERTYIFLIDEGGKTLSNAYERCRDGIAPQIDNLQHGDIHYIDRWLTAFERHEIFSQENIEDIRDANPYEYSVMARQGIHSYIEAPIIINGELLGFIGADNPPADKFGYSPDLLLSFAYSVGNALSRAMAEEKTLRDRQNYMTAVENAGFDVWVYYIREHRAIGTRNSMPHAIENVPDCMLPMCAPEDREKYADIYRRLEAGEKRVRADVWAHIAPDKPMRLQRIIYYVPDEYEDGQKIAYGLSYDITEQALERERFEKTIGSLLSANPDAIGSYRLNLTRNLYISGDSSSEFYNSVLPSDTADGFFEHVSSLIIDAAKKREYRRRFNRKALLSEMENGVTSLSTEYQGRQEANNRPWTRAYFALIRNPESGDVECVTYALDITKQVLSDKAFKIISNQEYDYVALLHLSTEKFEFLNLSSRLLPKYHKTLGTPGGAFDYAMIRDFAVATFIAGEDRDIYLEKSTIESITKGLEEEQGFEISVRGHYTGHPDEFMYRKIQHYYLDDSRDTVLLIQLDVTDVVLREQRETERVKSEARRVDDIIDSVATGICVFRMPDADHLEGEFVNLQMFRFLGLTPPDGPDARQEMLRDPMIAAYIKNAFLAVHPEDAEKVRKAYHDGYYSTHFSVGGYRVIRKDGTAAWVTQETVLREVRPDCRVFYASYQDITNEITLQKELDEQRKKELERTLFDTVVSLPACSVLYRENEDGTLTPERYSDEFCRLKGYTQENIRALNGEDSFAPVHPDDREAVRSAVAKYRSDGGTHQAVYRIMTRYSGYKWVSVSYSRFTVADLTYLYAAYADIDEIKKQEQQLEEQYNAAQAFLDSVSGSYLATRRANLTQNVIEEVRGTEPIDDIEGRTTYDDSVTALLKYIYRESDRGEVGRFYSRQALLKAYEEGARTRTREYQFMAPGGDIKIVRCGITLSRRPENGDIIAFSAVRDVTGEKIVKMIMEQVVAKQYDFLCCIDAKTGKIVQFFASNWAQEGLQNPGSIDYDEYMREYNGKYVVPAERDECTRFMRLSSILNTLDRGERCMATFTVDAGGGRRAKQVEFFYIDREHHLFALVRRDITEAQRQQLEQKEKLQAALTAAQQANVAKSDFLSRMSHDIRTPLNGIIGMTYLAQKERELEKIDDCLAKIDTSSKFLLGLINDILDMSKAESGVIELHPEPYNKAEFISYMNAVAMPLIKEKNQRAYFNTDMPEDFVPLLDKLRLNQIVFNILSNAVKFTPEGGSIRYTSTGKMTPDGLMRIHIEVSDSGIGMSEEFQRVLFDPFSQENRDDNSSGRGTGLGMAITKRLVDLMGGTISVDSELGRGTTFTVELAAQAIPAAQDAELAATANPGADADYSALSGRHVLLCEDHPMNQEIAKALLAEKGLIVTAAEDGEAGLEKFCGSSPYFYDAILMDIRMPVMDGYKATGAIRGLDRPDAKSVPIIAMTADAFADDIQKCFDVGMNGHISKPIDPEKLYKTLNEAVSGREAGKR